MVPHNGRLCGVPHGDNMKRCHGDMASDAQSTEISGDFVPNGAEVWSGLPHILWRVCLRATCLRAVPRIHGSKVSVVRDPAKYHRAPCGPLMNLP